MKVLSGPEVDQALDDLALVDRLETLFRTGCEMPTRHHHTIVGPNGPGSADATLLLMPAWTRSRADGASGRIGMKLVTVFPDNGKRSLPSIYGEYLLLDGATGAPLAMLDGTVLTKRRTACASGLASRYLSRPDASSLLMIGTGALAPHLIRVHAKIRPIAEVAIWGRDRAKAESLAAELAVSLPRDLGRPIDIRAEVGDRRAAVARADIVSCATLSKTPLVEGEWLREGQHVDLVGAFTPDSRESDDRAVQRARIYVDTRTGALKEAGDLVMPIASGVIRPDAVQADLFQLVRGEQTGRLPGDRTSITLFKSVGAALEDLAAAELAFGTA
ncbi:ornithine cyclodeaminase [Enhydrobacter aerosaccus]|uniref:Ornithine cyclodeaminase n=1 Tax=Enhydrobacter aerosaccus TaxID=225324 RepID=A0A1T4R9N5_9HYPH|nr:ornithine cyclodeaminase family protein [Enhydrobacter aerosaccus]SKA12724.1 ornithine cyclodeaminase [Enhydrobacter aerosaccus]